MYIGRFIIVSPEVGAYRVSSRSFPNRKIVERNRTLTVTPTTDAKKTDNPYVSYNCVRRIDDSAILGNGSHVDPIAEKLCLGYPPRDALVTSLLALDFEKDDYDTPRIAGIIGDSAFVGIVRRDALIVEEVTTPTLIATYEKNAPEPIEFVATSADDAAHDAYMLPYDHPVCAAGVAMTPTGFETAVHNG